MYLNFIFCTPNFTYQEVQKPPVKKFSGYTANVCMKFEKAGPNQTIVIDQTRLYMTDGPTDRQVQSNIPPCSLKWGHKNASYQYYLCFQIGLLFQGH